MFEWGWYNDVDAGIELDYFTTSQINDWSDSAWSNPAYDALYKQQATEMDQTKRLQDIYKLQQMIYEQSPYIPLAYSDDTEAWNTSRWTDWVQSPAKVGNVVYPPYGYETYFSVRPKTGGSGGVTGKKGVLIALAVIVVLAAGTTTYVLVKRRRGTVSESVEE
jgi:peptide/nickel transport system substrate-binding protein